MYSMPTNEELGHQVAENNRIIQQLHHDTQQLSIDIIQLRHERENLR